MALESVATILERTVPTTIQNWYARTLLDERLRAVPMSRERRCAHLPQLFRDLVFRLRSPLRFPAPKNCFLRMLRNME
jgi:hypothetical protein